MRDVTHFYKYKSADRLEWLEQVICRHELYCPLPAELNDPVEARPRLQMSKDNAERFLYREWCKENPNASLPASDQVLSGLREGLALMGDSFERTALSLMHDRFGKRRILSFSKRWNSMKMWVMYAARHAGCCFGFRNAGCFASAREVEYVDVVSTDISNDAEAGQFYFQKNRDWSTEEEIRLVRPRTAPPVMRFDPALLTRVIIGKDMLPAHRAEIVRWARARDPNLILMRAEYDAREQILRRVPV